MQYVTRLPIFACRRLDELAFNLSRERVTSPVSPGQEFRRCVMMIVGRTRTSSVSSAAVYLNVEETHDRAKRTIPRTCHSPTGSYEIALKETRCGDVLLTMKPSGWGGIVLLSLLIG